MRREVSPEKPRETPKRIRVNVMNFRGAEEGPDAELNLSKDAQLQRKQLMMYVC